ncbi:hypothetical protein ACOMHN_067218 [Nucella lapillus]
MGNSGPVLFEISVSVDELVLQSYDALFQLSLLAPSTRWCFHVGSRCHLLLGSGLLVLQVTDVCPEGRMPHLHRFAKGTVIG